MPVSRLTAEGLSADVSAAYARAEVRLLRIMGQHLAAGTDSPQWVEAKLAELQTFRRRADRIMSEATREAATASGQAITSAYTRGTAAGEAELAGLGIDALQSPQFAEFAVEALTRANADQLASLGPQVVRQTVDAYRDAVVKAAAGTLTGAATRVQDAQQALDDLARRGITGFTDKAGRQWGLQSYVDMATRSVTAQAAIQGHMDRLEQGGLSLFIVSDSPRECPRCRPWEGKVLSRGPVAALTRNVLTGRMEHVQPDATVADATADGLFHPNCTHNLSGYVHGATRRGTATHNPQGYAEKVALRGMERTLRGWKRRQAVAITPEAKRAADAKVRLWQATIRDHTKATGLPRKPGRESFDVTPAPAAAPDLSALQGVDLAAVDADVLDSAMADLFARNDYGPRFTQLAEELDRRDQAQLPTLPKAPDPVAEQDALNRLLFGADYAEREAAEGITRRTSKRDPEKQLRDEYETWVHTQWLRAEGETRGHLLSPAGTRALERGEFDVLDLFTRRRRNLEYASEELQRWFAEDGNGRMSYPEFRAGQVDDKASRAADRRRRNRGFESEFG